MANHNLKNIANLLEAEYIGSDENFVVGLSSLDEYIDDTLTFITDKSTKNISEAISAKGIKALVIRKDVSLDQLPVSCSYIVVKDPRQSLPKLIDLFYSKQTRKVGIHPTAIVADSTNIGTNIFIGAYSVIGENCRISDNVVIHPHVTIYDNVEIGNNSLIHAGACIREDTVIGSHSVIQNGAVLGADGFGYTPDEKGNLVAIPQVGRVALSDAVEVGANSCIDRAALGTTSIGESSKIDNLVQIGHNTKLGQKVIICGNASIAGSVKINPGVIVGGKTGIADHVNICSGVRLAGNSGVISSISEPGDYAGFPHQPAAAWRKERVLLKKLQKWSSKLRKILSD